MKQKLLNNTEAIAIGFMAVLALVTGGWNTIVCAVIAGLLIGLSANQNRDGIIRAGVLGAIASIITAIMGYIFNSWVSTLPGVDNQAPDHLTAYPLILAVVIGTITSLVVAWIHSIHEEARRKQAFLIFMVVCAVIFPFFDQCPTLAWNGPISIANPTVGCTTSKALLWVNAVIVTMIFALQALGLNIVAGYAGLLDLGYVAFFAIGAYTMGFLNSDHLVAQDTFLKTQFGFWLVVWGSAAAAAFFGLLLGAPTLPLRGDYLAIVTLGFGEIIPIAAKNLAEVRIFEPISLFINQLFSKADAQSLDRMQNAEAFLKNTLCLIGCDPTRPFDFTAGTKGISPISPPVFGNILGIPKIYAFVNGDYIPWYFLALVLLAGSAFFIFRLRDSRVGRAWVSMREDELAANAMGIDIVRTKLLAFIIGAMFSGFAGAFYASYVSFIEPGSFAFDISVTVLAMVILGGTGNITGVILGAFITRVVDLVVLERLKQLINGITEKVFFSGIDNPALVQFVQSIADATAYKVMLFGLILVVMMKVRPQGLIPAETAAQKRKA